MYKILSSSYLPLRNSVNAILSFLRTIKILGSFFTGIVGVSMSMMPYDIIGSVQVLNACPRFPQLLQYIVSVVVL